MKKIIFLTINILAVNIGFAQLPNKLPKIIDTAPSAKKFPYRIPFSEHTTSKVREILTSDSSRTGLIAFTPENDGDTVYAVRQGVVKKIDTLHLPIKKKNDKNNDNDKDKVIAIAIQHSDRTVASYMGIAIGENFVEPGDLVTPETPIGIVADNPRVCIISFLYMDTQGDARVPAFFVPKFATASGLVSISTENKLYTPYLSDKMMMIEMTRPEQKKYMALKSRQ